MTLVTTPEPFLAALRASSHLLLSSHQSPDGDAIGGELGLARVLRRLGKSVTVWNRDPAPPGCRGLPGAGGIHVGAESPPRIESVDLAVVLECPTLDRTGLETGLSELRVLNMDHHLGNQHYGEVNWIDTASPAVGEMVLQLARSLRIEIDEETADCLYLALASDTGGFRFSNASPRAFRAAADLVEAGADPERVAGWLWESRPEGSLRLLAEMLATLRRHFDGRFATVHLDPAMFDRAGAEPGDAEGLIDFPRSIDGVETIALLRCLGEGARTKVSLRSRSTSIDVEEIARRHGGGGHRNAAGFTVDLGLEAARDLVLADVGRALEQEA